MSMQNVNAVKYADLTDEHIVDIKKNLEMFVPSEEYWDKFVHHSTVPRGHKVYQSRVLIAPKVKESDISARAEFVAPRPSKIAVKTLERTVENYGDKAIYSREDLQFHFDDTIKSITATLKEIAVQKLDWIKGKAFLKSRAVLTAVNDANSNPSILLTAEKAAIIFRKNKVKRWDGAHYLAHITPEGLQQLRKEIAARGNQLSEPVKKELDGRTYEYYAYGDFYYSVTAHDLMYLVESGTEKQYIIFMGKREIDGESPIDVAKLQGESNMELFNNPLGTGVLVDVDGNYTADDNRQQGSVAINMDGLGACVSDDLCVLRCKFSINFVNMYDTESNLSGFDVTGNAAMLKSMSGNFVELGEFHGTNTEVTFGGYALHDTVNSKYYAVGSTIIEAKVDKTSTYTLASVTKANWTAYYVESVDANNFVTDGSLYTESSGTFSAVSSGTYNSATVYYRAAEIVGYADSNKTALVRVPNNTSKLFVKCAATAA